MKWHIKQARNKFRKHVNSSGCYGILSGTWSFLETAIKVAKEEQEREARAKEVSNLWPSIPTTEDNARMIAEARFMNHVYKIHIL